MISGGRGNFKKLPRGGSEGVKYVPGVSVFAAGSPAPAFDGGLCLHFPGGLPLALSGKLTKIPVIVLEMSRGFQTGRGPHSG